MKLFTDNGIWSNEANMIAGAFSNIIPRVTNRFMDSKKLTFKEIKFCMGFSLPPEALELPLVKDKGYSCDELLKIWQQAVYYANYP
jgi:hypothetical protein